MTSAIFAGSMNRNELPMHFELFNVVLTNIGKWYKSGKTDSSRKFGFCISVIVSISWIIYFFMSEQYWLTGNSVITIVLAMRGIYNNRKEQVSS